MNKLTLWEGLPFEIKNGRILRYVKDKNEFEELINGKWIEPLDKDSLGSIISESLWPPHWD